MINYLGFKDTQEGFNRYMVECEFVFASMTTTVDSRFNRYMVECEFFYSV